MAFNWASKMRPSLPNEVKKKIIGFGGQEQRGGVNRMAQIREERQDEVMSSSQGVQT